MKCGRSRGIQTSKTAGKGYVPAKPDDRIKNKVQERSRNARQQKMCEIDLRISALKYKAVLMKWMLQRIQEIGIYYVLIS